MEQEENPEKTPPVWSIGGTARSILDLTSNEYWEKGSLPEPSYSITEKYRNSI
jgi:putative GTP pyrophosphokinase